MNNKNVPPPYTSEQLKALPPILATEAPPAISERIIGSVVVTGAHEPHVSHRITRLHHHDAYKIDTILHGGEFHPDRRQLRMQPRRFDASQLTMPAEPSRPYRPNFLDFRYQPATIAAPARRSLRTPGGAAVEPYNIYQPDRRQVFDDTAYPYSTVGKVPGSASGVLVGPRHMLTASHVLAWQPDGTVGDWVTFAPGFFDWPRLGVASTIAAYYYRSVPPLGPEDVDEAGEDYAVCVLDDRLGDYYGWMGARVYDDDWNDQPYWWHIGYSLDIGNGGQRPSCQDQASFDDTDGTAFRSRTADMTNGDSGGPFFGFWDDGPYVVAVAGGGNADGNWCAGGEPMLKLINQALSDYP